MLGCWLALGAIQTIAVRPAMAQSAGRSEAQLVRRGYDSHATQARREYLVYLPTGYHTEHGKLWPVILFLHGYGERGDAAGDLESVLLSSGHRGA